MHLSTQEYLRRLSGERKPKVSDWQRFRGKATLSYAINKSGLSATEFSNKYIYNNRTDSKIMNKWMTGKAALYRLSAENIDKNIPGTTDIYDLPLFELMANEPISETKVNALLKIYCATKEDRIPFLYWKFPNFREKLEDKTLVLVPLKWDTDRLVTCNDIYSFTAILGLVRIAESTGEAVRHMLAFKNLIRALPSILKLPWIQPHADILFEIIKQLKCRMFFTNIMFDIDMDIIWRHTHDPDYQPVRERRPINPITKYFTELEDPILAAEIIPGSVVKIRHETKAKRSAKKEVGASR